MAFENYTVHLKIAPFDGPCRTLLELPRIFLENAIAFEILKIPCKGLCLQITAKVRKITKSTRFDLTFTLIIHSEKSNSSVKIRLILHVIYDVSFIKTRFY